LDVHARSVVAGVIDDLTGQRTHLRVGPQIEAVLAWVSTLPGPVAVAYEAGPTGFGLARALRATGVRCEVVAPSKLERPLGDRVKTDRRDARRLARLLRIGEISTVRVPTEAQEAARDLVRAREDARGDLMRARHRVSKLLLRRGAGLGRQCVDWRARAMADLDPVCPDWAAAGLSGGPRGGLGDTRPPEPAGPGHRGTGC
jgi:transposase